MCQVPGIRYPVQMCLLVENWLTEYMTRQKLSRTRGSPPILDVTEMKEDKDNIGSFILEDKEITDSRHCRTLGMNLDGNLSWDGHLTTGKKSVLPETV